MIYCEGCGELINEKDFYTEDEYGKFYCRSCTEIRIFGEPQEEDDGTESQ